jgi:HD superfamily phosphohydrolase YqeK
MQIQQNTKQPNTQETSAEISPERQYVLTHLTRLLGNHYLWYIVVFAAFLSIFSFIPFFASLFGATLSNGWDSTYYMSLYRVIFVVLAAIISWRFGTRRGIIGGLVISVVIFLPSVFGLRTGSLFLDTGAVLLGLAGSAIIGREGNLQRALFKATSDLKNQTKQLKLEIAEREKDEKEIRKLSVGAIESLVFALEAKDTYTAGHSRRVAVIAVAIGHKLNLSHQEIEDLAYGSLLHDVGKIAVDRLVQNKPGALTSGEYAQIMVHVQTGADIVKPIVNESVVAFIEHHHDHYNNSDKQQTATGDAIPLGARIIAVADALDAMTSDRPYRAAMPTAEALEELRSNAGTQFDPVVVKAFLAIPLAEISVILQNKPKPVS